MEIPPDRIAAIRLASHHLSDTAFQTPKEIVSWMGAMQAQDYSMAKLAIGVRLPECTDRRIEDSFNRGDILRTHVMRPTWHFVTPENIRGMLLLSGGKIKSSSRSRDRDLGITAELYSQTNRIIRKALEGNKHLTKKELTAELEKAKIKTDTARMTHFMIHAEADAIVCSGALRGKEHTYALLDERAPAHQTPSREEALANLVQAYFQSHCPATLQDFVWWSGLSLTEAKKGMEAVRTNFFPEKINGQTYWTAASFSEIPKMKKSAFLLPAFDEYIIAYADRRAILPSENLRKAVSSNGIFRPVIVVNGQVVGTWKKSSAKTRQPILFDYFEQPGESVQNLLHATTIFR
ncbi:MAG: winged helix DNA-binding domain-containing protein [Tannerella sp.]|jgi:hypothetical protein|nr:winged helix DNA-binding domain-containing protein [Tannerella sp.]